MKKLLCAIICIIAVLSAAACSSQSGDKEEQAKQPEIKQGVVPAAEKGVEAAKETKEIKKESAALNTSDDFLGKLNASLSRIAEEVKPSVVNISTTKSISAREHPFGEFFDDPLFRKYFGDRFHPFGNKKKFKASALGSGVIVTGDGYILTNNHVVQDVDEIKVTLHDKREFEGRIIGTDPKSDLAIVKVDVEGLPAIKMGVSEGLKVGELVIAIGNPFGLGNTITMGIISAVGRSNVGIADYEDFIQTDAAINPGNSGGALVNIRGELIGVNTAIFSTSGGYMGIGFAIPSDMAGSIMESIIKHGKVVRGWLGVTIQNVSPDLAKHFDIKEMQGALITEVMKDSPAERAGFQRGDVIVEFDGKLTEDPTSLRNIVAGTMPDKTVPVKVIRGGKEEILTVVVGEMPGRMTDLRSSFENALAGVHVQDLTSEIEDRFKIPEKTTGVIVTNIDEDSMAAEMLRRGDVIQEINRKVIKESGDYEDVVSKISGEENILLLVYRGGGYIYVTINAEK